MAGQTVNEANGCLKVCTTAEALERPGVNLESSQLRPFLKRNVRLVGRLRRLKLRVRLRKRALRSCANLRTDTVASGLAEKSEQLTELRYRRADGVLGGSLPAKQLAHPQK